MADPTIDGAVERGLPYVAGRGIEWIVSIDPDMKNDYVYDRLLLLTLRLKEACRMLQEGA